MFGKKVFTLLAGYVAGSVISSIYNAKKGTDVKKNIMKKGNTNSDSAKIILDNFVATHISLFKDLKTELLTEENKEKFLNIVDEYKVEGKNLIAELQNSEGDYSNIAKKKLTELYNSKKAKLQELGFTDPKKLDQMKTTLLGYFEEIKKKIGK